jgi:hypothetical protein
MVGCPLSGGLAEFVDQHVVDPVLGQRGLGAECGEQGCLPVAGIPRRNLPGNVPASP